MKIPELKPSERFLGKYAVPCLAGQFKSSEMPGVATRYRTQFGEDPTCDVYLRTKAPEKTSPWMQAKLEQLFERDGLTAAVAEGLKELDGFNHLDEQIRHDIKSHGYHPYVFLREVILDEIKQVVLILIDDVGMDIVHEHGGTIYQRGERWYLESIDHYFRYASKFEKYPVKPDRTKWDAMFPPPPRGTRAQKDCSFLYGRWESSNEETNVLRAQVGWEPIDRSDCYYSISETHIEGFRCPSGGPVVSVKRRDSWITVQFMVRTYRATRQFWCDGSRLIEDDGTVYRKRHRNGS